MARSIALWRLFLTIFVISAPGSTLANPFDFGFSSSITVVANVDVLIPAAIINRGDTALDFNCAAGCFGLSVQAAPGEGLNALNFEFFFPVSQFAGLILEPNERFDFIFGEINFDPSNSIGNPFGTILPPTFAFRHNSDMASLTSTISVGVETAFSPLTFVASTNPANPVPETRALLYLVLGFSSVLGVVATMETTARRKRG